MFGENGKCHQGGNGRSGSRKGVLHTTPQNDAPKNVDANTFNSLFGGLINLLEITFGHC